MNVIVRTSQDPLAVAGALRDRVTQLDRNLPAGRVETVHEIVRQSFVAERFRTWLFTCFAAAAVLLATLGIGGLLTHSVGQRMPEFGVRVALGANRLDLLGLLLGHSLRLSITGVIVGLLASLLAARTISDLLYETSPFDPATFVIGSFALILFALGACLVPAWRVFRLDPVTSLRAE